MQCRCPEDVSCRPGEQPFGVSVEEWATMCRSGVGAGGAEPERPKPVTPRADDRPVNAPGEAPREVATHHKTSTPGAPPELTPLPVVVREPSSDEPRLFAVSEPVGRPQRKPVTALSPSSATKLAQCPRQFEENKVLGKPEPSGRPAVIGKFGHKVLEWLTGHPLAERTEGLARDLAGRLWRDITAEADAPVATAESDDEVGEVLELRADLVQLGDTVDPRAFKGETWAALAYAVSIERDYGGEVAFRELRLWDTVVNGVKFRGKADRVDRHATKHRRGLVNVDYKFGAAPLVSYVPRNAGPDAPKLGDVDQEKLAQKAEQLLWYWSPVEQKTGERVVGALLAYIGAAAQVVLWVDESQRPAAEAKLARLWRDLQKYETAAVRDGERYPANPTPLCGWCPFFEDCRDGSQFLLDRWEKDEQRVTRWGKPPVPAHEEVQSWPRARKEAWWAFARAR